MLERAGMVDPESLEDYILHNGYEALGKALTEMTPGEISELDKIRAARARRGGFPDRHEVELCGQDRRGPKKYVICNADESEPGTFKDRLILEGDPIRSSKR